MTKTIAETRVRAQVQEYDGMYYLNIEVPAAEGWYTVAKFAAFTPEASFEQAREAGWGWLVGEEVSK